MTAVASVNTKMSMLSLSLTPTVELLSAFMFIELRGMACVSACERKRERGYACVKQKEGKKEEGIECVCVCVCMCMYVYVCACVCLYCT